jgi:hypothetical protein
MTANSVSSARIGMALTGHKSHAAPLFTAGGAQWVNRSYALASLRGYANSNGLRLFGCGIDITVSGPKRADYPADA